MGGGAFFGRSLLFFSMPKSPHKLSQTLTEEQYQALKKHIPALMRRRIFDVLINGLIELYESPQGEWVNSAILSKKLKVTTILDAGKNGPS